MEVGSLMRTPQDPRRQQRGCLEGSRADQQQEVMMKLQSGQFPLQHQALIELKGLNLTPDEAFRSGIGEEVCRLRESGSVMAVGKDMVKQLLAGWLGDFRVEESPRQRVGVGGQGAHGGWVRALQII